MSSTTDIGIKLSADTAGFTSVIARAVESFKTAMQGVEASSTQAKAKLTEAFSTLNVRSFSEISAEAAKVREAFNTIASSAGASGLEVTRASDAMKAKLSELSSEMRGVSTHAGSAGSALSGLGAKAAGAVAGFVSIAAAMKVVHDITKQGIFNESQMTGLAYIEGSATKAKEVMETLRAEANRTGQSLNDLIPAYVKLSAATKGTNLAGEGTMEIFKGVNAAAGALHLGSEKTGRALLALSQMLSKGTVSSEELKGQFGEAIPIAFAKFAEAAGLSVAEFTKALENGKIKADEFVPKLAAILNTEFGDAAAQGAETLQGKMNQLGNEIQRVYNVIAESGFFDALKKSIQGTLDTIDRMKADGSLDDFARKAGEALGAVVQAFIYLTTTIVKFKDEIAVVAALGALAWTASAIAGLRAMTVAAEAAAGGMTLLSLAMRAIPVVAAFAVGWEIGTLISEQFNVATKSVDNLGRSIQKLAGETPITDISKVAKDISAVFSANAKLITEEYKAAFEGIVKEEAKTEEAFKKSATARAAAAETSHQNFLVQEQSLATKLKVLEVQKNTENLAFEKERTANQALELSNRDKNHDASIKKQNTAETALTLAMTKLEESRTSNSIIQLDKKAKAHAASVAKIEKQELALQTKLNTLQAAKAADTYSSAFKERELAHKEMTDKISAQESALKASQEAAKQAQLASDRSFNQSSLQISQARLKGIDDTNEAILAGSRLVSKELAANQLAADEQKLRLIEVGNAKTVNAYAQGTEKQIEVLRKGLAEELENLTTGLGRMVDLSGKQPAIYEAHGKDVAAAMTRGADLAIAAKNKMASDLKTAMDAIEGLIKTHAANIIGLEKTLADSFKTLSENKFDISLIGTTDAQKLDLYRTKVDEIASRMVTLNAAIAASGGKATEEQTKELSTLRTEMDKYGKSIAQMGKDSADSVYTTSQSKAEGLKIVEQAARLADEATKAQIESEKTQMESKKVALSEYKTKLDEVKAAVTELNLLKIEISTEGTDLTKLSETMEKFSEIASRGTELKLLTADAEVAIATVQTKAKEGTEAVHTVKPETTAVDNAIARLQQNTYSTHYIKVVEEHADGGPIGHFAEGGWNRVSGSISGAGTSTSDSIRAMLSDGEFVMKAASVQKFGVGFMNSINNGNMPSVSHFAAGGLAGSSSTQKNDTVNINLAVGNQSFAMMGAREQAHGLASALKQLSRGA